MSTGSIHVGRRFTPGRRCRLLAACGLAAAAMLAPSAILSAQSVTQPTLKAAFLLNFAKFVEWPGDATQPLTLCVFEDAAVEDALAELVNGGPVGGRPVVLAKGSRALRTCHLLYVGGVDPARIAATLDEAKAGPILTVGDGDRFVRRGGMIGFFVEDGRMRFAINPDTAQRAGLRLSSRLLSLARIVKDGRHGQS